MELKDFEIMAPVGSRESLAAAIQAGADSIYFGIENLNMRARSANTFTIDDLREIARTCDEHGMKSYLTVNTIIYDQDIPLMRTIVRAAKDAGISAIIAADVAVMTYARKIGQEVHLSTQLNISNVEALRFYAQFACCLKYHFSSCAVIGNSFFSALSSRSVDTPYALHISAREGLPPHSVRAVYSIAAASATSCARLMRGSRSCAPTYLSQSETAVFASRSLQCSYILARHIVSAFLYAAFAAFILSSARLSTR